jgi:tetratricopeptide (TPR) repeat protein/serine phosphatase RsbU (regulator of sigma subunit)
LKLKLTILFAVFSFGTHAQLTPNQEIRIDSLKQVIQTAKHDTIVVKAYVVWDDMIYASDALLDLELNEKVLKICEKNLASNISENEKEFFYKNIATSTNNIGIYYHNKGDFPKAITYYTKCFDASKVIDNKRAMANVMNNLGIIYWNQGDYSKAIVYYTDGLKIMEERGDKKGIARSLNGIGVLYRNQKEFKKSLEYNEKSLKIRREINDEDGIASSLTNIGAVHMELSNNSEALKYLEEALGIYQKLDNKSGSASVLNNIGIVHKDLKHYDLALEYYQKSLRIKRESGNHKSLPSTFINIGTLYFEQNNLAQAQYYSEKSYNSAFVIGSDEDLREASLLLSKIYKKKGDFTNALVMYETYIEKRDTLISEENTKKILEQEFKYTYEKQADSLQAAQAKKDALLAAEQQRKDALAAADQKRKDDIAQKNTEKKNLIIYSGAGGLLLILLFTALVIKRLQITRKQKGIIEAQKDVVEHQKVEVETKNKEILDSIHYAKRLQEAILPPTRLVKEWLPQSFILYKPKDIVAGDFYWMETVENTVYFAAADCTGHGVPGAMVSVVCSNALTKALLEEGITAPAKILDRTRELVIDRFGKSEEDVKDGMDISVCALNTKTRQMQWAGANNPLWIIRNESNEIEEIKANKQPIGKHYDEVPFTNHSIQLNTGDSLYIFSDGYSDQFGGDRGKKYKSGKFKNMLLSIQNENMLKQRERLNTEFENWRGELEQIDDVCVIGVKI